ncbi:hypothetical protein EU555_14515 [Methylobacterium nonmethylotrophicum]|uniref:Bacteriophage Mx8 p63 C-terminal domain-containing protein n=2 Tax=Methylobacterium nonmethylotrophicum TaxID=1141884 RepID=A0A4Z0NQC3_9HYPH|nr:hypothetical protein EU555_14515 [Methylobacterium nonmethylotrophicum]
MIPVRWHSTLFKLAEARGIDLSADDFLDLPRSTSEEGKEAPDIYGPSEAPKATHWGEVSIGDARIPAYVLDNGARVFSLKGVVVGLIGTEGGQLGEYLKVKALREYLPADLKPAEDGTIAALMRFDTGGEGHFRYAVGFPVERFLDLCAAYSMALQEHLNDASDFALTPRQLQIAKQAMAFERACAKVGIIALVDEATGYQYERAEDALQFKLKLFLSDEMRKWESTFPDELWKEFGRLTKWSGPVHSRPKYWGKLVMELIYDYIDPDIAKWLKENKPKPRKGQNYHQWLNEQYGLKRLMEHIWLVIGMAAASTSLQELKDRLAERFGRYPVQMTMYLPAPNTQKGR